MNTIELKAASRDKLLSDLKILLADADSYLRVSAGQAGEAYAAARARLEATLGSVKVQVKEVTRELAEKTRAAAEGADTYVHENPWQSMALGAAVGLLAGLLIGRR
jgi:ElaB/YqjD/DUF883 family membrane-anchored ribosome-binding protein